MKRKSRLRYGVSTLPIELYRSASAMMTVSIHAWTNSKTRMVGYVMVRRCRRAKSTQSCQPKDVAY